jgi:hypothetical protein
VLPYPTPDLYKKSLQEERRNRKKGEDESESGKRVEERVCSAVLVLVRAKGLPYRTCAARESERESKLRLRLRISSSGWDRTDGTRTETERGKEKLWDSIG